MKKNFVKRHNEDILCPSACSILSEKQNSPYGDMNI